MSIEAYKGPTSEVHHGAIVPVGAAKEITQEEYERRQKEVSVCLLTSAALTTIYLLHSPPLKWEEDIPDHCCILSQ